MDLSSELFWFGCKRFGCDVFGVCLCRIKDVEGVFTSIGTPADGDVVCTMREWRWLWIVSFVLREGEWAGELSVRQVRVLSLG